MALRPPRPSRRMAALAIAAILVLVAACGQAVPTVKPPPATGTQSTSSTTSPTDPSPGPTAPTPIPTEPGTTPAATPPGQTDTAWGRIWDDLPPGFPAWPGSHPTQTGGGPASAILDAGTTQPAELATFFQSGLELAGYSTVARSGPLEDGSWELDSSGDAGCAIRISMAPLGGSTIITILYGAACPFG